MCGVGGGQNVSEENVPFVTSSPSKADGRAWVRQDSRWLSEKEAPSSPRQKQDASQATALDGHHCAGIRSLSPQSYPHPLLAPLRCSFFSFLFIRSGGEKEEAAGATGGSFRGSQPGAETLSSLWHDLAACRSCSRSSSMPHSFLLRLAWCQLQPSVTICMMHHFPLS